MNIELVTPQYAVAGGANWQVVADVSIAGLGTTVITTGAPRYWVNGT